MSFTRRTFTPPTLSFDYLFSRFKKKLVNTVCSTFQWENLPESIDETYLNTTLIECGKIGFIKHNDKLYCVRGDVGGGINAYEKPTEFIYANVVLGSGNPTIKKDIAVIFLSTFDTIPSTHSGGLSMLIDSTATILADNTLSLNIAQKNSRLMLIASADNEQTANSAENTLKAMYNGEPYKVANKRYQDSFEVNPLLSVRPAETIRQLIETHQYTWSAFLQELGINSNFNLKRERLVSSEVELNGECLDTLIDDIESNVNRGVEMVNSMFGTDIKFHIKRYGEEKTVVTTQQDSQQDSDDNSNGGDNDEL